MDTQRPRRTAGRSGNVSASGRLDDAARPTSTNSEFTPISSAVSIKKSAVPLELRPYRGHLCTDLN